MGDLSEGPKSPSEAQFCSSGRRAQGGSRQSLFRTGGGPLAWTAAARREDRRRLEI